MRFALTQKLLTYALACVAALPLGLSAEIGGGWSVALLAMAICGWFIEGPLAQKPLWRNVVTTCVAVVLGVQVWRYLSGAALPTLAMELSFVLLGAKLCTRGSAGDHYQIAALSFIHVIAATIAVDDLSYAAAFVLFVAIAPPMLAVSYLRREMEKRFGADPRGQGPAMLERLLRSKRIVSLSFVAGSAALSLPVLFVTALLFVGFPRIGWGFLGKLPQNRATVGFGDAVTLGDLDITRQDETVALRLVPLAQNHEPTAYRPIRLRGAAFDIYRNGTWSRGARAGFTTVHRQDGLLSIGSRPSHRTGRDDYEIMLEALDVPVLFLPSHTARLRTFPRSKAGVVRPQPIELNSLGEIRYRDEAQVGVRYAVMLAKDPVLPGNPPMPGDNHLDLENRDPRQEALAEELAGVGNEAQRAQNLALGLRSQYRYALELSGSAENDAEANPLDRFLFSRRSGTCEHFASALTLLLRYQGIPARMVTGFLGAQWNPLGGYYAVRQKYAHAWTEAWVEDRWQTLDATPPATSAPGVSRVAGLGMFLDTLRMRWHKYIIGFDASLQMDLAKGLKNSFSPPVLSSFRVKDFVKGLALLIGIASLALLVGRALRRFGVLARPPAFRRRSAEIARATALYKNLEKALATAAAPRPAGATPLEHAAQLAKTRADIAAAVEAVTRRYLEVRFGLDDFVPGELPRLESMTQDIAKSRGN
jgi:transglutaminase-like putative cysteine protease